MDSEIRADIQAALDGDDAEAFLAATDDLTARLAVRFGFGVAGVAGTPLPAGGRTAIVENRTIRAVNAISELQAWLHDDDPEVRQRARAGIHRCLYEAYTGDRPESARGALGSFLRWLDDRVTSVLGRSVDPDQPARHLRSESVLAPLRLWSIALATTFAVAGSALFVSGRAVAGIALILGGAAVDILEGSLARAAHISEARHRWISCVASHFGDVVVLTGLTAAVYEHNQGTSLLLLGGTLFSLVASLVRVSALQTGFRFWRSRAERVVRYVSMLTVGIDLLDGDATGYWVIAASVLLVGFAMRESFLVTRAVLRLHLSGGGFIFLSSPEDVHCWSFDVEEAVENNELVPTGG